MVGREQQRIEEISEGAGRDDGEPCDARSQDAAGENSEQGAEYEVAGKMPETGMQRQRGDRAPELRP